MTKALLDNKPINVTDMSRLHVLVRLIPHDEHDLIQEVVGDLKSPAARTVAELLLGERKTAEKSLMELADDLRQSVNMPAA